MNYYNEIKNKLIDNEIYRKVKDYSKEKNRTKTYFEIGKILNEAGRKVKKYNKRTLSRMRQFYLVFSNKKVPHWGHNYLEVIVEHYYH